MAFSFGGQPSGTSQTTTTPFSFGSTAKTSAPTLSLTNPAGTSTGGFSFGLNKSTASTNLFGTATTTSSTGGFAGFGGGLNLTTTSSAATTTAATTGFSFNTPAATTAAGFTGFGLAKPATTATGGFGLGSTPASSSTFSLGGGTGLFSSTTAPASGGTSIFSSVPTSAASTGLGGLDPNTALKQGAGDASGAAGDGKTFKESILPEPLTATVDTLLKFVKEEKTVREDIARMSSKPMVKVQEDVTALKQLLSVVANGLQRNACAVDKLKQEMTQKLKNAEMAQRTKDVPAGLQYENTAPTEYFQRLVDEFEDRMVMYRQQIETLDRHLAAMHQANPHSPEKVLALLKKLHETFISLAAQLQVVHENVKGQKDQFLTYRRVFHGDSKNIFHKSQPAPRPTTSKQLSELAGPTPFPGTSNTAAHAMAMVHARSQQPQGPPVTGLAAGTAFGSSSFGTTGIFGSTKPAMTLGSTTSSLGGVGSLFSSTTNTPGLGDFGSPASASTTAALNLAGTGLNNPANGLKQPFQLQKPPLGAKRGKR